MCRKKAFEKSQGDPSCSKELQKDRHNVSRSKVIWMKRNLWKKRNMGFATHTGLENIEKKIMENMSSEAKIRKMLLAWLRGIFLDSVQVEICLFIFNILQIKFNAEYYMPHALKPLLKNVMVLLHKALS